MAERTPGGLFSGLSRNTFLLALSSLFADISTEMIVPVLPIFLTQSLKVSASVLGLVEGIAGATQNVTQGLAGSLSDKLQHRKPIALMGYFLAAVGKPLMGLATMWQAVLGGRFIDRLGAGTRSAPRDALIASSVAEADRGRAFGLEGAGDNAGACLGPLLAVLLFVVWHLPIRVLFYLAVIPGLLAFSMVLFVRERPIKAAVKSKIDVSLSRFPKAYCKFLLATALFGIGNSSNAFLILETKDIGASLTTTILIYAGFNLVAALISYPAGSLSDRLGRRNLLVLSIMIFFITYLGFATTHNVAIIGFLFAFYGLYQGIIRSVGKALASDYVSGELRASAIGWYNTTIGFSGLAASLIGGRLWDTVGHPAVFFFGAAFAAVGALAFIALIPAVVKRD
ncbi:MAG: MFS transporter [Steroidobacteraceae bacterium]